MRLHQSLLPGNLNVRSKHMGCAPAQTQRLRRPAWPGCRRSWRQWTAASQMPKRCASSGLQAVLAAGGPGARFRCGATGAVRQVWRPDQPGGLAPCAPVASCFLKQLVCTQHIALAGMSHVQACGWPAVRRMHGLLSSSYACCKVVTSMHHALVVTLLRLKHLPGACAANASAHTPCASAAHAHSHAPADHPEFPPKHLRSSTGTQTSPCTRSSMSCQVSATHAGHATSARDSSLAGRCSILEFIFIHSYTVAGIGATQVVGCASDPRQSRRQKESHELKPVIQRLHTRLL